jgi:hypothetical protein
MMLCCLLRFSILVTFGDLVLVQLFFQLVKMLSSIRNGGSKSSLSKPFKRPTISRANKAYSGSVWEQPRGCEEGAQVSETFSRQRPKDACIRLNSSTGSSTAYRGKVETKSVRFNVRSNQCHSNNLRVSSFCYPQNTT